MGELEAANEVLRLGIQWAGESGKAGSLYLALGRASVASEKHGEAIGLLRRAIRLGAEERDALTLLAESLSARDQSLAAMVCNERARELGANADDLEAVEAVLQTRLGEAWPRFQAWMRSPE
jgi:tetratricopeptide (TPR) repeat protein